MLRGCGYVHSAGPGCVPVFLRPHPPGPVMERDEWSSYLDWMRPYSKIVFCGDFNAHHVSWGCSRSTPRGSALYETSLGYDLVSINDSCPTYISPDPGTSLDLGHLRLIST